MLQIKLVQVIPVAAGWCGDPEVLEEEEEEEGADSQQRPMARSGRADTAAVLTTRMTTSMKSVHPSAAARENTAGPGKGGRQVVNVKARTRKE